MQPPGACQFRPVEDPSPRVTASSGRMVKPRLAEAQFPTVEKHTHRSVPEAMTREEVPLFDGHRKFSPMSTQ
jgi:hypothetical protein